MFVGSVDDARRQAELLGRREFSQPGSWRFIETARRPRRHPLDAHEPDSVPQACDVVRLRCPLWHERGRWQEPGRVGVTPVIGRTAGPEPSTGCAEYPDGSDAGPVMPPALQRPVSLEGEFPKSFKSSHGRRSQRLPWSVHTREPCQRITPLSVLRMPCGATHGWIVLAPTIHPAPRSGTRTACRGRFGSPRRPAPRRSPS